MAQSSIMSKGITRREAIASTAAGVAAAGIAGAAGVALADEAQAWDEEYDFVVCGSGTALWGALAAADAGMTACVLEKQGILGGTSKTSTGAFFLPWNPVCEQYDGLEDNEADAIAYIKAIAEGQGADDVMEAYPQHSRDFVNWSAESLGVPWQVWGTGTMDMWGEFIVYYDVEGARYGRTLGYEYVVNEGADLSSAGGYLGPVMWNYLEEKLDEFGIVAHTATPADRLVTDETGRVVGVIALTKDGQTLRIKANKGVLLGCGDFSYNKQMRDTYLRNPLYFTCCVAANTGDGIRIGQEIGADLGNMSSHYGCSTFGYVADGVPEDISQNFAMWDADVLRAKPNSIIVNANGRRFGNEASNYHPFDRAFEGYDSGEFCHGNIPGYWICDSTYMEYYPLPHAEMGEVPEGVVVADTLEELAEKCGINKENLLDTVATFNGYCETGVDLDWHRGEKLFDTNNFTNPVERPDLVNMQLGAIAKAPFYCLLYLPGTLSTSGGLRINANAQVLNVRGEVIPGLYASGCNAAGVYGPGYPGSGGPIGAGSVMSYVAAFDAAAR